MEIGAYAQLSASKLGSVNWGNSMDPNTVFGLPLQQPTHLLRTQSQGTFASIPAAAQQHHVAPSPLREDTKKVVNEAKKPEDCTTAPPVILPSKPAEISLDDIRKQGELLKKQACPENKSVTAFEVNRLLTALLKQYPVEIEAKNASQASEFELVLDLIISCLTESKRPSRNASPDPKLNLGKLVETNTNLMQKIASSDSLLEKLRSRDHHMRRLVENAESSDKARKIISRLLRKQSESISKSRSKPQTLSGAKSRINQLNR
jgi:hypothetical protein